MVDEEEYEEFMKSKKLGESSVSNDIQVQLNSESEIV
jgi:hypothetical protein